MYSFIAAKIKFIITFQTQYCHVEINIKPLLIFSRMRHESLEFPIHQPLTVLFTSSTHFLVRFTPTSSSADTARCSNASTSLIIFLHHTNTIELDWANLVALRFGRPYDYSREYYSTCPAFLRVSLAYPTNYSFITGIYRIYG